MNGFAPQKLGQKVLGGAAGSAKQAAQGIAKRIAQEQLETLKSARDQVGLPSSEQTPQNSENRAPAPQAPQAPGESQDQLAQRLNMESKRLLENLEAELAQIRRKKEQEELQKKQVVEQQQVQAARQDQAKVQEAPTLTGKMRKAMGGMKKKVQNLAGKREQQKNVSG